MGEKVACSHAEVIGEWAKMEAERHREDLNETYPNASIVMRAVGIGPAVRQREVFNRATINACKVCTAKYVLKPGKTADDCPNKDQARAAQAKVVWWKHNK